jgi:hypothetical protein
MDPLLPATPDTLDEALKAQALDHLRELLDLHWREAKDSADEDGRFAIGFKVAVTDGAPVRVKVTSRISRTVTDEIESTVDDPGQPRLL